MQVMIPFYRRPTEWSVVERLAARNPLTSLCRTSESFPLGIENSRANRIGINRQSARISHLMTTIRIASQDDAIEITRVVNTAFEVERPMRAHGSRTSVEDIQELMQHDRFFVAEQGGRIVGAVFARISGTTGYFGMLSVEEELRRSGLGRRLREKAEQFCKQNGCTEMTLTTGAFRTELIPYYEHAGYNVVRIEPGPAAWGFDKPFEVVHMAKPL